MGSHRFASLDALRGICALTVILFHCGGMFAAGQSFCHGYLAVDIFFILSGFVIAHSYDRRLSEGLTAGEFLKRRLLRLAPVYWAGTVLCAAAFALASWPQVSAIYSPLEMGCLGVMAIMLAPQLWFHDYAYPINLVAWSLAAELIANLLYARWLHRFSSRALLAMTVAGWGMCLFYAVHSPAGWDFGAASVNFYMCPLRAMPAFLAGVLVYRAHRDGRLARLPALPVPAGLLAWVLIASVPASGPTPWFDALAVALAGPLLIGLQARSEGTVPRGLLWLGAISYPLYASHRALISVALDTPLLGTEPGPLRGAMVAAAMLAVAAVIYYVVERAPRAAKAALMERAALS